MLLSRTFFDLLGLYCKFKKIECTLALMIKCLIFICFESLILTPMCKYLRDEHIFD